MRRALIKIPGSIAAAGFTLAAMGHAYAETRQYCVKCQDPDQTYVCSVDTPHANPSDQGLQLYCIIRTSKDGGHKSCTVDNSNASVCAGPVKTYTFTAPAIPQEARDAADRLRQPDLNKVEDETLPPQKGGEPKTLIEMTGRAVGASKRGLQNTGEAVGSAADTTKETVGKAARGVGKAAGKVGSVTKKTGGAVGHAAKTAWDCMKSLFKDCGS